MFYSSKTDAELDAAIIRTNNQIEDLQFALRGLIREKENRAAKSYDEFMKEVQEYRSKKPWERPVARL